MTAIKEVLQLGDNDQPFGLLAELIEEKEQNPGEFFCSHRRGRWSGYFAEYHDRIIRELNNLDYVSSHDDNAGFKPLESGSKAKRELGQGKVATITGLHKAALTHYELAQKEIGTKEFDPTIAGKRIFALIKVAKSCRDFGKQQKQRGRTLHQESLIKEGQENQEISYLYWENCLSLVDQYIDWVENRKNGGESFSQKYYSRILTVGMEASFHLAVKYPEHSDERLNQYSNCYLYGEKLRQTGEEGDSQNNFYLGMMIFSLWNLSKFSELLALGEQYYQLNQTDNFGSAHWNYVRLIILAADSLKNQAVIKKWGKVYLKKRGDDKEIREIVERVGIRVVGA